MIAALAAFYGDKIEVPVFEKVEYTHEQLEAFAGSYHSDEIPLPIEVTHNGKELQAQAQSQPSFTLSVVKINVFSFDQAGLIMEFDPAKGTFILKQGGGEYLYKKN